jgi:hypothetical protein
MLARAALAVLGLSTPLFAQTRPLLTEPAETARGGTVVFETGMDFISSEPNFVTGLPRDRYDGPLLRLVFSPADNVEIDVESIVAVFTPEDPAFGSASDVGDFTLRAKARLLAERPGRPGLSARFAVTLPETKATKGLGPNSLRMLVQVLVSKTTGRLSFHANAGLAIHDEVFTPAAQNDFLAYGAALAYRATAPLQLVGEVTGRAGSGSPGADHRSEARLGVRFGSGRVVGDAAVRRGLTHADGTWGVTAGLSWTLHRPRASGGP